MTTSEHKYPFRTFILNHRVIPIILQLETLGLKLINIEIIKFYKSLLKSKDQIYMQRLISADLFNPVFRIFKATYHPKNPPLIQSCIRDLFDIIFNNQSKIDIMSYPNQKKLVHYLTATHQAS